MEQTNLLLESLVGFAFGLILLAFIGIFVVIDIRTELRRFNALLASFKAIKQKKPEFLEGDE